MNDREIAAGTDARQTAVLLGRREELLELDAALDDARRGKGGLIVLTGEGGIGKTRLLESFVNSAQPTGVHAAWGRCWEGGAVTPFWPWRQVLAVSATETSCETLIRHLNLSPSGVGDLLAALTQQARSTQAGTSESSDARLRLFDSITDLLLDVAADGGLIVILDDLHAADEASLELLDHLADRLSGSRVLLLGAYRDTELRRRSRVHRLMDSVARRGRVISLGGLDERDVHALLQERMGKTLSSSLTKEVHRATQGNPFFVEEAARLAQGDRSLCHVTIAQDTQGLIHRRLDRFARPVRRLLALAAVMGPEFDLAVLRASSDLDTEVLLDALGEAITNEVLREVGLARWSFAHGLLRQAVYDQIATASRAALHRQVGDALEQVHREDLNGHLAELADHFFEAACGGEGPADRARHYCTLAGDAAMKGLAFEEAAFQYGRALDTLSLAEAVDQRLKTELLLSLGQAKLHLRELPDARAIHRQALKSARAADSAELFARAALGLFGEPESRNDETRTRVLEEAITRLPDEDDPLRARALVALAATTPDRRTAVELSNAAVDMARRLGDRDALWATLWQWHHINHEPDLLERRLEVAAELVRLAADTGHRERLQLSRQWRGYDLFVVGDIVAASTELEQARQTAEELRLPFLVWGATYQLAAVALLQGRFAEAERLSHQALRSGERTDFADVEGVFSYQLFALRREQGRFEDMELLARRQLESSPDWATALRHAHLALARAELGRVDEARREVEAVMPELLDYWGWGRLSGPAVVAEVCWLLRDTQWAEPTYESLGRWPNRHVVVGVAAASLGGSDRYLGQLATLLRRWDDAEAHFQAAHRFHSCLGGPAWLAHGRVDHARMLIARGRRSDVERAGELVAAARETYRALGMTRHERRAAAVAGPLDAATGTSAATATFVRQGDYWVVEYAGVEAPLRDSKGLQYLLRLLSAPGQPLHALDLVVDDGAPLGRTVDLRSNGENAEAERARLRVIRAVGKAIDRISAANPALGDHLRATIRTGIQSSYTPDQRAPIRWNCS